MEIKQGKLSEVENNIALIQNNAQKLAENINSLEYISKTIYENWQSNIGSKPEDFHNNMDKCLNTLNEMLPFLNGFTTSMTEFVGALKVTVNKTAN